MIPVIESCPNRIAYCCQECNAICCWYCDRRLRDPDAAEVKTIANRFCDEARCVAAEAIAHGLLRIEQLASYRARRKKVNTDCGAVIMQTTAEERAAYLAAREAARPTVEERMRHNLELAGRFGEAQRRLDKLEERAHAVGALLAGPSQNEGVIDKDRVWHDLENPDGSPCQSFEEELAAIERIVAKLEAA